MPPTNEEVLRDVLSKLDVVSDTLSVQQNDKTQQLQDSITDMKREYIAQNTKPEYKKVSEGIASIATTLERNAKKLTSDDPAEVASGVTAVLGTAFTVAGGPVGTVAGAVLVSISAILSFFGSQPTSISTLVHDAVKDAFDEHDEKELLETINADMTKMKLAYSTLSDYLGTKKANAEGKMEYGKLTEDIDKNAIADSSLYLFIGQDCASHIMDYITDLQTSTDDVKAKRAAKAVHALSMHGTMRLACLVMYSNLLLVNAPDSVTAVTAYKTAYTIAPGEYKTRLNALAAPTPKTWCLFTATYTLESSKRTVIANMRKAVDADPMAEVFALKNTKSSHYLFCRDVTHWQVVQSNQPRPVATTAGVAHYKRPNPSDNHQRRELSAKAQKGNFGNDCLFCALSKENSDAVQLFNMKYGICIYGEKKDFAYDKSRRRVFGWDKHTWKDGWGWKLEPNGEGIVRLKDIQHNEYLYEADYGGFKRSDLHRIFTWRKGNTVNQGYFKKDTLQFDSDRFDSNPWNFPPTPGGRG